MRLTKRQIIKEMKGIRKYMPTIRHSLDPFVIDERKGLSKRYKKLKRALKNGWHNPSLWLKVLRWFKKN